ncbi:MAG TPA: DUF2237 domain-containing protein [Burkholderiaceae bacterium]|nr:DUF2237 domain-containing protein [Burkholderiaceae bacterium]
MERESNLPLSRNVLGGALTTCGLQPRTGFQRDGCCEMDQHDRGLHVVCAKVTQEFLEYSRTRGNDLVTARPEWNFPGLKPGDRWCLCAARWREALEAGVAPPVILEATHEAALAIVNLAELKYHALVDEEGSSTT